YYVSANKGGQEIAKTDNYVISFIDPPFIGDITAQATEGLEKEDWKLFIKGRISRPFYKRWWVYAIAGAVAIPVTAVLAGGGSNTVGPPTITLAIPGPSVEHRDSTFGFVCQGEIPLTLTIVGGKPPFEALFTVRKTISGGSTTNAVGFSQPLDTT